MKYYILYNPLSGNGQGSKAAGEDWSAYGDSREILDVTKIDDMAGLVASMAEGDAIILCGGDGTLNHFINDTRGLQLPGKVYFRSNGTGNDFLRDIGRSGSTEPVDMAPYLTRLPRVTVNGETRLFLNGVGYGIDGYCCEVGDKLRQTSDKPINYTGIAIKGLLFHFRPRNATVTVDGKTQTFSKVWLAPTMNGRFYGGGMMATPDQDRLKSETVSTLVMYGSGKLRTLAVFPSIFKGEHIKHDKMVKVLTGREITVEFDRPTALQIDGETVLGVRKYTVKK